MDFVNQSATDPTLRESGEKNDFSEKLGEMNHRYTRVSGFVVERIKSLEMVLLRWEDYDRAVKSLDNWFIDQEAKLGRFERMGHLISVQQSLRECKVCGEMCGLKGCLYCLLSRTFMFGQGTFSVTQGSVVYL